MPMSRDDILSTVHRILVEDFEVPPGDIQASAHLFADLGLDSLDAVDLIVTLEEAFGGRVDEVQAKKARTVADVCALVEALIVGGLARPGAAIAQPSLHPRAKP